MSHSQDLDGRVALVTGASRGIGLAVVRLLRARGSAVAAFGRSLAGLEALAAEPGPRITLHGVELTDPAAVRAEVTRAGETHGGIDAVINNAGIAGFDAPIDRVDPETWTRTLGVNLDSIYHVSQPAIPFLRGRRGGVIVNVASVHALATASGVAPYAASKGAVVALTRAMAMDLATDRIRVVAILPGATDTEMLEEYAEKKGETYEQLGFALEPGAIGRVMTPHEVAEVIVFAASSAASALNACAIPVDAGLTARL
jgi:NAD(P)-dependent dehydrogenase (short-subunit alcohol dehydrogenase family)